MLEKSRHIPLTQAVHAPLAHDSAVRHVSGEAVYVDDIPEPQDLLHVWVALSTCPCARITVMDLDPVKASPGIVGVFDHRSIPGVNDCSPTVGDDPIFAADRVDFAGQVLFAVAAKTELQARDACAKANIAYAPEEPVISIAQAQRRQSFVLPSSTLRRGQPQVALKAAAHRIQRKFACGGQDHFYLEGQVAMAVPKEGGDVTVYSSTQHPTEVQTLVAQALDRPLHAVTVEVRRMGGAFGGKETQAAQWACIAALVAQVCGQPAKVRLDRDIDMLATGKRHDFIFDYDVGFSDAGLIEGLVVKMASRCGYSADLSLPINDRALLHLDNAYYLEHVEATTQLCRTNTVSNTAFRGFGGPQGMLCIERIIDDIACYLRMDPLRIRLANYYGKRQRNRTPYGMKVTDFPLRRITQELARSADYSRRRERIEQWNQENKVIRRGIALTPVKFGISFTMTAYNHASALIHVYTDGSIHLNHGGTEMGQGLFIKVAQVVADEFSVPLEQVKIVETNTSRVPNTAATAASSGSDINGKAAQQAAQKIKARLSETAAELAGVRKKEVHFLNGMVIAGRKAFEFADVVQRTHQRRVPLSATGYYRTPKINWDRTQMSGRPFLYFGCGAAVSEVAVDCISGEHRICRVDVLHDVGQSLNPAIDLGQIEGAFVQGAGWLTSEELWWDERGKLQTHAPSTYKIPTSGDVPEQFNVTIWEPGSNPEPTIYRSKAVGEPPLMLAISVFNAITHAVSSLANYERLPDLDAPATPERTLAAIGAMK